MGQALSQMFPPQASLTEQNLGSQKGKIFIVTGGTSGVGYHLASILFHAGGKVYVAGRSEESYREAVKEIESRPGVPPAGGHLEFLYLELDNLSTIRSSAEAFLARESRLDVLWNNAGVSTPPAGSVSEQGYELQLATNCLGPLLFTKLLLPILRQTSQGSPRASVRIVWTSSQVVDLTAPKGGIDMADLEATPSDQTKNYTTSKTGNWFLASELGHDLSDDGILSLTTNPGNLKTNLLRHYPVWLRTLLSPILHDARFGAYTELWAGLSSELDMSMSGGYVVPWGRMHSCPRSDMLAALKPVDQGGTGQAAEFRFWCEKQLLDFV